MTTSITYNSMSYQPKNTNFLNVIGLRAAPDFEMTTQEQNNKPQFFYTNDARTKDNFRGLEVQLDKPSYIGCANMDQAFSIDNSNYKFSSYSGYKDMNNGQLAYYIDESIAQPFNSSVYTLSGLTKKQMFVDPMGANKPQYTKLPYTSTLNAVSNYQHTRDALSFREDLMSLQSRKRNQQSYVYFNTN